MVRAFAQHRMLGSLNSGVGVRLQTSYILAVNSGILSDTGGTCTDADCTVRGLLGTFCCTGMCSHVEL